MRSLRLALLILVFAAAAPGAPPAAAAPLLSLSFTVTGGTFSGPALTGTITGGSVRYAAPAPYLSTPAPCFTLGACGSITAFTLVGAAGTFQLLSPALALAYINPGTATVGFTSLMYTNPNPIRFRSGTLTVSTPLDWLAAQDNSVYGTYGIVLQFGLTATIRRHQFTIGNEVRTFVPEPTRGMIFVKIIVV